MKIQYLSLVYLHFKWKLLTSNAFKDKARIYLLIMSSLLDRHYIMMCEEAHIVSDLMCVMLLPMFVGHLAVLIIIQI